jgi:hypothetical protein
LGGWFLKKQSEREGIARDRVVPSDEMRSWGAHTIGNYGALNKELNFWSSGFLYLDEPSRRTGGFNYWSNQGRFKRVIDGLFENKGGSIEEAKEKLKNSLCLLQSVGCHSPKLPNIKPDILPSSIITHVQPSL